MAVRGPKAQALAAEVADVVTFALLPGESREDVDGWYATSAPSATSSSRSTCRSSATPSRRTWRLPIPTPAALPADSLTMLPEDPAAADEEIQRRREELGFSYFVIGAGSADALAPVVAGLAGR